MSRLLRLIGIGAPSPKQSDQDRALASYFQHLEVYSPKESRFIGIRFTSIDPDLAAAVANRIAETYRDNLARQSVVQTDDVQKALEPKIAKLADEAAAAEAAGRMTQPVVDAFTEHGLFALMVPSVLGGAEADIVTTLEVLEEVCRADGSTGWSLLANVTSTAGDAALTAPELCPPSLRSDRHPDLGHHRIETVVSGPPEVNN